MTSEKKNKEPNWIDNFNRYFPIIAMLGGPAAILGLVWIAGQWFNAIETKSFDSPEQKVYVVQTVKDMPTPAQQAITRIHDSLDLVERSSFRKYIREKDSINMLREKQKDCLLIRLNDQVYQLKEQIKRSN